MLSAGLLAHCGDDFGYETRPLEATCKAPNIPPPFYVASAFDGLAVEHPTDIQVVDGSLAFVVGQTGKITRLYREGEAWKADTFLDVHGELPYTDGESGLLSIALAPDFASSGTVYVSYISRGTTALLHLGIYRYHSDGKRILPESREEIFGQDRPEPTHHGGKLRFGPDGYLYVALGDGVPTQPLLRPQDPNELYGKIMRIDVSGPGEGGKPYRIPPDNPFVGKEGRPEVYAYGLRNPWSLWFDDQKRLWVADVGSDRFEEINIVVKGGNYGWPYREGTSCLYSTPCDSPSFIDPVVAYPHVNGFAAIGGFIYNGSVPSLKGRYIYGDFMSGRMWSASSTDPKLTDPQEVFFDTGVMLSGIAPDANGEILALDWYGNRVFRIAPTPPRVARGTSLRALGCLEAGSSDMARDLVPYDVNAPLWSDGAAKKRWVTMPRDKKIAVAPDDVFTMPAGTMFLKEFSLGGRRIETRMMYRDPELDWLFYAFKWNAEGTDATLVGNDGETVPSAEGKWDIPSQSQCLACHGAQVGRVRGFEIAQINRNIEYPNGEESNQLATMDHVGYFDPPLNLVKAGWLAPPFGDLDTLESRARSYLHANCSFCHSVIIGVSGFNLTKWQTLADLQIVCRSTRSNDFGIKDARVLYPGKPEKSLIVHRMSLEGHGQMPPIGRKKADTAAIKLISDWIRSMGGTCAPQTDKP